MNDEAYGFFFSSSGLRQGEPFSPLLLIFVMEILSKLLNKVVEEGFLNGCHVSNPHFECMLISHLLVADNILIFCKPDESNFGYLRCILSLFEAMSGLGISLTESALILIGEVPNIHLLGRFFGCDL